MKKMNNTKLSGLQKRDSKFKVKVKANQPLIETARCYISHTGLPYLTARINNTIYDLSFQPSQDEEAEFFTYDTEEGKDVYRRSLCFILEMACFNLFKKSRIVIGLSLMDTYYYDFYPTRLLSRETLNKIQNEMDRIIKMDLPLERQEMPLDRAKKLFKTLKRTDKCRLLKNLSKKKVLVHMCNNFYDITHGPLVPRTGYIHEFSLDMYSTGFLLRFPNSFNANQMLPTIRYKKLFQVYQESKRWGKILKVDNVANLNEIISEGKISDFIKIAEALHEKKIANIADKIYQDKDRLKLILIAGPSCSGKTTFSKRLAIQMRVNGLMPVTLSLDNYFVDRAKCPKDQDGNYDFENLHALDIELFNKHLNQLFRGEKVYVPVFDFHTGKPKKKGIPLKLKKNQMLIVEGIHGLNEQLTDSVPAENKFKIYVSPLTQLNIDDHNRISTRVTRLLRRIVRDYQFRSYEAVETLRRWPSVHRGEMQNIFPFQEQADVMFNSALVYELSVIRHLVEILLQRVKKKEPEYNEAQWLLNFLSYFLPIKDDEVPPTSILREFIGGSSFHY